MNGLGSSRKPSKNNELNVQFHCLHVWGVWIQLRSHVMEAMFVLDRRSISRMPVGEVTFISVM